MSRGGNKVRTAVVPRFVAGPTRQLPDSARNARCARARMGVGCVDRKERERFSVLLGCESVPPLAAFLSKGDVSIVVIGRARSGRAAIAHDLPRFIRQPNSAQRARKLFALQPRFKSRCGRPPAGRSGPVNGATRYKTCCVPATALDA